MLIIPKTIKVRIRNDHPSTPLGFVTYVKPDGQVLKNASWAKWGNSELGEFDNTPKEGYTTHRVVSRSGSRSWYGSGKQMFEMVSPDGFRFQITSDNLFELISTTNIIDAEIQSKCVLAFDGQNLVLINEDCEEYLESQSMSNIVSTTPVKTSELVVGQKYVSISGEEYGYYIGKQTFAFSNIAYYKMTSTGVQGLSVNTLQNMLNSRYSTFTKSTISSITNSKIEDNKTYYPTIEYHVKLQPEVVKHTFIQFCKDGRRLIKVNASGKLFATTDPVRTFTPGELAPIYPTIRLNTEKPWYEIQRFGIVRITNDYDCASYDDTDVIIKGSVNQKNINKLMYLGNFVDINEYGTNLRDAIQQNVTPLQFCEGSIIHELFPNTSFIPEVVANVITP